MTPVPPHLSDEFLQWYDGLRRFKASGGPAKGTLAGAIVVLDRLQSSYDLDINSHLTESGTQIQGASGQAVRDILEQFGEVRTFVSEGGRTNRGLRSEIEALLTALRSMRIESLPEAERNERLQEMQGFLVDRVRDFFSRQRLKIVFDSTKSVWQMIHELLELAREDHKEGPVAQYLVGAKLQLRFPDQDIENLSYSTADVQTNRAGDFAVEDTVFHVTVAPMSPLFEKCTRNLRDGLNVYVLTPHQALEGARQQAELIAPGRITVASLESFIAQNIEELTFFSRTRLVKGFRALLEMYNKRTDAIEIDKSLLIQIPSNLENG